MIAFSPSRYPFPLPEKHRFPVQKYALLREKLEASAWQVHDAALAPWSTIEEVHATEYLQDLRNDTLDRKAIRALGFPWTQELLRRSLASVGGTLQAAQTALETGFAANLAGGTHHAFADRGEGFCVLNDAIITARKLHRDNQIQRAVIVDLDVHQGNGTAKMAEPWRWLHTISMHGERNYPFVKQRSNLDIPLDDGMEGKEYLSLLQHQVLPVVLDQDPDLVILNAGADVLDGDRYGRLKLSIDDIVARDDQVAAICQKYDIPLVWVMGGGYHPKIEQTVEAHWQSLRALATRFPNEG